MQLSVKVSLPIVSGLPVELFLSVFECPQTNFFHWDYFLILNPLNHLIVEVDNGSKYHILISERFLNFE